MDRRSESARVHRRPADPDVQRLHRVVAQPSSGSHEYLKRIPVRDRSTLILVPTASVATVAAHGERLTVATLDHQEHSMYYRLKDLEQRLDPAEFVRVNRGLLVNVNAIARIVAGTSGTHRVILHNGAEARMSRIQVQRFRRVLVHALVEGGGSAE
jgi:two-component system, LytTR family, response regulator